MAINNTLTKMEFSKWITASSCSNALTQANAFWASQNIVSASSGAICFQHVLYGKSGDPYEIEWLIQSKIKCRQDCQKLILKDAFKKDWGREDILN